MSGFRRGLVSIITRLTILPLNFLAGVIVARLLGPAGKGQYSLFLLLVNMGSLICSMGLGNASIFFLRRGEMPRQEIASATVFVGGVAGLIGAGTVFALRVLAPGVFPEMPASLLIVVAGVLPVAVLKSMTTSLHLGIDRLTEYNVIPVVDAALILLSTAVGLGLGGGVFGFAALYACATAIATVVFLHRGLRLAGWTTRIRWGHVRPLIGYGLKTQPSNLFLVMFYQFDQLLLAQLADLTAVGVYSVSATLASIVLVIPNALGPLLFAKWSERDAQHRSVPAIGRLLFLITLFAGMGLVLVSPLLTGLFGPRFSAAQPLLLILLPGVLAMSLSYVYLNFLASVDRPHWSSVILGVALVLQVAMNLVLIPAWGAAAAAFASTASYTLAAVLAIAAFVRLTGTGIGRVLLPNEADLALVRPLVATVRRRLGVFAERGGA